MNTKLILIGLLISGNLLANEANISKDEYVKMWKSVAISEMIDHGIPASITLAQGILESSSGNSLLAQKGNNHFGIKCHGWEGKKMYKDDDEANECFRVYKNAESSFIDHSDFLRQYERYAFLFTYDKTDYKSWAHGLKKAGYATNPKYPSLLIKIIEDLELYNYDEIGDSNNFPELTAETKETNAPQQFTNTHDVINHEYGVKYVVAKKGDTFYQIAQEFGLNLAQLHRFNDFSEQKDVLTPGDIVYIQPKRRRNLFKQEKTTLSSDMSVREASQVFAINERSLMRLNELTNSSDVLQKGETITLR